MSPIHWPPEMPVVQAESRIRDGFDDLRQALQTVTSQADVNALWMLANELEALAVAFANAASQKHLDLELAS